MKRRTGEIISGALLAVLAAAITSCSRSTPVQASEAPAVIEVGVTRVQRMPLGRQLTLSSELVPFQEIDVYAKEAGYVKTLNVDYGTHVKKGQLIAVLEIPELQAQLQQDQAAIANMQERISHAEQELSRVQAQQQVVHLQYERLHTVADSKPGLVAQQEVDEAQGKDLAGQAQVEASKSTLQSAQSELTMARARLVRDQALYDYSRITAPFSGVITERVANLGTLVQAGTNSSTQALPIVKLSEDDLYRLVIPVPESYVKYIHVGDPVSVKVSALNKTFPGKVARFSVDVKEDTRTMHTEVDVPNPTRELIPGMYAEASIQLEKRADALGIPLQAIDHQGEQTQVDVVDGSNRVQEREVTVGIQSANHAEILSGLREGDEVIVSDRSALKPGQTVRPKVVDVLNYESKS